MNPWLICHLITCFLLAGSLIVGLTRKETNQITTWNWCTRVCYAIMVVTGCVLCMSTIQVATLNTICKLVLSCASIGFIEIAYSRKKGNKLTKKVIYILVGLLVLTIACGFILAYTTSGSII